MISRSLISLCAAGSRRAFERDVPRAAAPRNFALAIFLTWFSRKFRAQQTRDLREPQGGNFDENGNRRYSVRSTKMQQWNRTGIVRFYFTPEEVNVVGLRGDGDLAGDPFFAPIEGDLAIE